MQEAAHPIEETPQACKECADSDQIFSSIRAALPDRSRR
jgi:hypothetical protein